MQIIKPILLFRLRISKCKNNINAINYMYMTYQNYAYQYSNSSIILVLYIFDDNNSLISYYLTKENL